MVSFDLTSGDFILLAAILFLVLTASRVGSAGNALGRLFRGAPRTPPNPPPNAPPGS